MTTYSIDAQSNALVDGVSQGHIFDAIHNQPSLRSDLKAAFDQFWIAQQVVAADAVNACNAALAAKDSDHATALAQVQAQLDALGGSKAAQTAQREAQIAQARASILAAQAILAAADDQAAQG